MADCTSILVVEDTQSFMFWRTRNTTRNTSTNTDLYCTTHTGTARKNAVVQEHYIVFTKTSEHACFECVSHSMYYFLCACVVATKKKWYQSKTRMHVLFWVCTVSSQVEVRAWNMLCKILDQIRLDEIELDWSPHALLCIHATTHNYCRHRTYHQIESSDPLH
jgi:hypothetical protein